MKTSLGNLRSVKIPEDYDAVVLDAGKGGMIYPADGRRDKRYQKLFAGLKPEDSKELEKKLRGKVPIKQGMALSKGDDVISASGVKVKFKDPGWRHMRVTLQNDLKGREVKVGDYIKTGPKPEQSIGDWIASLAYRAFTPSPETVKAEFQSVADKVHGGTAVTGVRGESVVKIRAGDLRALIREAANTESSKDEN